MAFSKSKKGCGEQGKRPGKMSGEPASGLSRILEFGLADESQHQIIQRSHHFTHMTGGHARGIFLQSNIAAVMQTGFNPPVSATDLQ